MIFDDAILLVSVGASTASVVSSMYYAAKAILTSHQKLGKKIDDLVGVVQAHQYALDSIGKDVQLLKTAGLKD